MSELTNISLVYCSDKQVSSSSTTHTYTLSSLGSNNIGVFSGKYNYYFRLSFPSGQSYGYSLVAVNSWYGMYTGGTGVVVSSSSSVSGGGSTGTLGGSDNNNPSGVIMVYWPTSLGITPYSNTSSSSGTYQLPTVDNHNMGVGVFKVQSNSSGQYVKLPSYAETNKIGYASWSVNCHMENDYGSIVNYSNNASASTTICIAPKGGGTWGNAWYGSIIIYWVHD